jgi:hypothetical protein
MSARGMKLGFNFVPMPQQIWDDCLDITIGEIRLLGWLIRYTVFFGSKITVTDDEVLNGIKKVNGTRSTRGVGLSRNGMKNARVALEDRGWLVVCADEKDSSKHTYTVNLVSENDTEVSRNDTSGVTERHLECQSLTPNKEEEGFVEVKKNKAKESGSLGLFKNEEIVSSPKKGSKAPFVLPDWIPAETWKDYEEMRRVLRKPMTDRAKSLAVKELMRFKEDGHSPESILTRSIMNSWQGLYAPTEDSGFRSNYQAPVPRQKSPSEQLREQGIVPGGRSGR